MPITKRLITNAAVLLALVAATLLGAGYLTAPPHVAQGHDGGSYDGTGHARGEHHTHSNRAWTGGSRCIGPGHIANKHTQDDGTLVLGPHAGFTSGEYTTGAGKGTSTAKNLSLKKEHIEDTWEVRLTWRPAGWKAGSSTWGCQPHTFQVQRKIENGPWERWNTGHPDSSRYSEVTSQRRWSSYGGLADYAAYKHPTTGTPETVHFRVCNKDQGGNIGACTGPISTSLGGNPWHPEIEASVTNKPVWEDTSTLQVAITTDPPPPDGATDVTLQVRFNVDKADDDFEAVTSHSVSISAAGTGSLSVTNPFTRTGADFTEDRSEPVRVKLASGANSQDAHQFTLNVLDDDPIPITVNFPDDDPAIYAVDGPGTKPASLNPSGSANYPKRFQIGFTSPESVPTGNMGDTRCPKLAGTWNLDFTSSNTQVVGNQTMEFGCNRSKDVTVQSAGAFSITPGTRLTHASQGWTRPIALTGDTSFSGTVHASNSVFPSKLGVGFSASTLGSGRGKPTDRHGERLRLPRPPRPGLLRPVRGQVRRHRGTGGRQQRHRGPAQDRPGQPALPGGRRLRHTPRSRRTAHGVLLRHEHGQERRTTGRVRRPVRDHQAGLDQHPGERQIR